MPARRKFSTVEGRGCLKHYRRRFEDDYEVCGEPLGKGGFGLVVRAKHRATGVERAVKAVDRWNVTKAESKIMLQMDHPHVIQLHEVFESGTHVHFVMELCSGGDLFDRVVQACFFSEAQAALVLRQALQAVSYMHSCQVAHRDLKPENFLFAVDGPIEGNTLKLIDFGVACSCGPDDVLKTQLGSPYYVSPQVLEGRYDKQCDVWSIGVIMHILLIGRAPFKGRSSMDTFKLIRRGSVDFQRRQWSQISEDAKFLVRDMLRVNPHLRLTADAALRREWIESLAPNASADFDAAVIERLSKFKVENELRKAALNVAARSLAKSRLDALKAEFQRFDADGDGKVSLRELRAGLRNAGMDVSGKHLRSVMANLDGNASGAVAYTDFLAASLDTHGDLTDHVLWTAFNVFDQDGDGKITIAELSRTLPASARRGLTKLMREVDTSGDGEIDFHEFSAMMRTATP
uniref:Non-specific serine/threonine protein kinase n=1 Tax=Zooxanthella nutricula TaxID=1333877 RepID=A0A6V0BWA8_9DINO